MTRPVSDHPDTAVAKDRDESAHALLVALMRTIRLVKRIGAASASGPGSTAAPSVDPALMWALHVVDAHEPVRLSDLAGHMHLDVSTASRHVRSLEESGHVRRTPDPDDRRAAQLALSDQGRELLRRSFMERCKRLDTVLVDWPESDLLELERLLSRLADDLEQQNLE